MTCSRLGKTAGSLGGRCEPTDLAACWSRKAGPASRSSVWRSAGLSLRHGAGGDFGGVGGGGWKIGAFYSANN